jgi:DNA polymerase-3 subunit gamma/tau
MRDGLSLLDQAVAFGAGKVTAADIDRMLGLVDHGHVAALLSALAEGRAADLLAIVAELVAASRNLDGVLVGLAEVLHRICLVQAVPDYRDEDRGDWDSIRSLAGRIAAEDAQLYYQIAVKSREELGIAPDPRTGLEMALLRMLAFRPAGADSSGSRSPEGESGDEAPGKARSQAASRQAAVAPRSGAAEQGSGDVTRARARPARVREETASEPSPRDDEDWIELSRRLQLSGQARELARNQQLRSREQDRWEFVIAHSLRHLGSAACVDRLSRALSDQLGHEVRVCLIDSDDLPLKTAAQLEEQRLRTQMTDAEIAINQDPTIRALQEQMGARIIADSIQPLQ